jgi:hypothetical protein
VWRGVIALGIFLALSPAAHADASPPTPASGESCRRSRFEHDWSAARFDEERSAYVSTMKLRRDLDGDGAPDTLDAELLNGSRWRSVEAKLQIGARTFEASASIYYYEMASYVMVPKALVADAAARRLMEEVLFTLVCDGPDPSLERLLDPSRPLHWVDGAPKMPETYAIFSTRPEYRARVELDEEEQVDGKKLVDTGAAWILYDGRDLSAAKLMHPNGHRFREAKPTRSGARTLRALAHAVILSDGNKHSWLYVSPHGSSRCPDGACGQLPRFATVSRASFEGEAVLVERFDCHAQRIDLATGVATVAGHCDDDEE